MQIRDLERLALGDVISLMVSGSGKGWDEVGAECGWSPANMSRIRNPNDPYWPSLPVLARLCVACGSTLVLDWVRAQAQAGGAQLESGRLDAVGLLTGMGELMREVGRAAQAATEALEDARIGPHEARRIIRELHGLCSAVLRTISGLRPISADGSECWGERA